MARAVAPGSDSSGLRPRAGAQSTLANIGSRRFVNTEPINVLILGFLIGAAHQARVVVRHRNALQNLVEPTLRPDA